MKQAAHYRYIQMHPHSADQGPPTHHSNKRTRHRNSNESNSVSSNSSSEHENDISGNLRRRRRRPRKQQHQQDLMPMPAPSEFIALDCEMVGIGPRGHTSSVARVTLIDWSGQTLLDEYIRQTEPVTDYRTHVSGITEEQLQTATCTSFADCQTQVLDLLESHILVGHALKNDLRVLGISHPWWLTRDTAKYEPFMQVRFDDGILWPRKLKDLCTETLHRDIQVSGSPHCPYEDALAALDLYRSVREKWEKVVRYKWNRTNQILKHQQQ